jgi:hypothetical protein
MLDAHRVLSKMDIDSLNLFSQTHFLNTEVNYASDLKTAQILIYYKYYEKLCALNVVEMQEKWFKRLKDAINAYEEQFKTKMTFVTPKKRGRKAIIIKQMLLENKTREEIKIRIAELFPETPLGNIGCQIAATICFLKKRGEKNVNGNKEVRI